MAEWLARRTRDLEVAGSIPDQAMFVIALGKQFTLTFPSPPTCKMATGNKFVICACNILHMG